MELSKLVFPPVFPHSVLCYKTHFLEHSKAVGRGHLGRAGTVFLVTQARTIIPIFGNCINHEGNDGEKDTSFSFTERLI